MHGAEYPEVPELSSPFLAASDPCAWHLMTLVEDRSPTRLHRENTPPVTPLASARRRVRGSDGSHPAPGKDRGCRRNSWRRKGALSALVCISPSAPILPTTHRPSNGSLFFSRGSRPPTYRVANQSNSRWPILSFRLPCSAGKYTYLDRSDPQHLSACCRHNYLVPSVVRPVRRYPCFCLARGRKRWPVAVSSSRQSLYLSLSS
ncbi:hypothetical protein L209DRAFT_586136 [Thermothelomyces heterothallicus CBS 203.75]